MHRYVNRNDCILISSLLVISAVIMLLVGLKGEAGESADIYVDGVIKGSYPLDEEAQIKISGYNGGTNILEISDGCAHMTEASCPDKLCIHQGKADRSGQSIVCLPNRVVVKISGKDVDEYDAVTR